jgi:peptidoglycan-binding protein ArfA
MATSEETRTITDWRTDSKFYRRPPGLGWLLALLAVPLLLALLGWGVLDKSKKDANASVPSVSPSATVTAPSVSPPSTNLPGPTFAPLSIIRSGNGITLSGDLPDADAKAKLLDMLKGVFGPNVNLIDNLTVKAGAKAPDLSGLGNVVKAAVNIPDFNWKVDGDTITLKGNAPSDDVRAAVEAAAKAEWSNLKIDNQIQFVIPPPPASSPAPAPAPGTCASLQNDINALLRTPINFETDGSTPTPGSQQMLTQVADKLKACPTAKVAVSGHTDNTGNDAINVPLSDNRARSVAAFLISQGVPAANITSKGFGSANPVASNNTPEGRTQNRRVDITVS